MSYYLSDITSIQGHIEAAVLLESSNVEGSKHAEVITNQYLR